MRKRRQKNSFIRTYLTHHLRVLISSLGTLTRQPMATLMTTAVIAIALALPTGLYIALNNIGGISQGWDDSTQISLFLKASATTKKAKKLAIKLQLRKDIKHTSVISKEQGLEQFKKHSGFGDALKFLDKNPLPIVITIQPVVDPENPEKTSQLLKELKKNSLVELAQLDMQWVKRLYALLEIAQRSIWVISALLGLAVLLVTGNTIRLDIQNRRSEIEISKLIGASDAFIRRPFLYTGIWYGFSGGVFAWLLTSTSLFLLDAPAQKLAMLYHSTFRLSGLSFSDIGILIGTSCLLGLCGSWLAVGRHLSEIEPT